ncbi:regulator of Ty1 transposition protein 105 [Monosporozyma unispora]|nr:hypothetical protein C6P44_003146 [Kazachstania unispora]
MSSLYRDFNSKSSPPTIDDHLPWGSSPTTPLKSTKDRSVSSVAEKIDGGDVVNSIIFDRSSRSSKYADNPHNIGSSPLTPKERSELRFKEQQNKSRSRRVDMKEKKSLQYRGGLEKMENFIMKGERTRELNDLARLAQDNAIPDDMIDNFEDYQEQVEDRHEKEDEGEGEDEDLIQYFEDKEKYEKELEQLLSELSVS